ncbi:hypothetical protein [Candidatus Leptofilum sp.]|uniref:hypothetical protein n=1 Tax=Candidatus Leptofilum sp. TaxID=3241576 RepID=UPI003B5C5EA5
MITFFRWSILLIGTMLLLTACTPPTEPASFSPTEAPDTPPLATEAAEVLGCADGGPGVFTPEDVRCYLASFEPEFVREIDEDTAVLFTDPNSTANWIGGAIIYHIPTVSSLVLDANGDADPQVSHINGRTALVAYQQLAFEAEIMEEIKLRVQELWQTSDSGELEIRLSMVWQDGPNSLMLAAIAGIPYRDGRFYCAEEFWTIGELNYDVLPDCVPYSEGSVTPQIFFRMVPLAGSEPQPVQVEMAGVASNVLRLAEGELAVETAVYQTAIQHVTTQPVVVRNETLTDLENAAPTLDNAISPELLHAFIVGYQRSKSLDFLFHDHQTIHRQPGWFIERDYLPPTTGAPDCAHFRREYSGLGGGVISVSQIGFSPDGRTAILFLRQECGETAVTSSYLLLENQADTWTVVAEYGQLSLDDAGLEPGLVYNGRSQGCGDLLVYKANSDDALSEFLTVFVDAFAFPISEEPLTLELANHPDAIIVKIDLFGDRVYNFGEFPYCNDVGPEARAQSVWLAESGTVGISINGTVPAESCIEDGYEATVQLTNVTFASGEETVQLDEALFEDVYVGWCAG